MLNKLIENKLSECLENFLMAKGCKQMLEGGDIQKYHIERMAVIDFCNFVKENYIYGEQNE